MKKKKFQEKQQGRSLAQKTSYGIGVVVVICMAVMVVASACLTSAFLTSSINSEFAGIASKNGVVVQSILDIASDTATTLQDYIEYEYEEYDRVGYTGETEQSEIYNVKLQRLNKEIEEFVLSTAWSTVGSNEDISAIGVYFEAGTYDPAVEDYSIYVNNADAQNKTAQSGGAYKDYSAKEYYKQASETKQIYFTKPYESEGTKVITASYPIMYKGELQGIVAVDINIANFAKLEAKTSRYPSMYVDILTEDSTMVYDSESDEYVGQRVSDLLPESQYRKIQAGIDTGESFKVSTKRDNGTSVVRYYTPIQAGEQTWWAVSVLGRSDLNKKTIILVALMLVLSVVSVVVIVTLAARMIYKYIRPLNKVVDASQQLRKGDFEITIKAESDDEIGKLSDAFADASSNLRNVIHDLKELLNQMAESNFNITPKVEYPGDFAGIKDSVLAVVADLSQTISEINLVSEQVASNAENISEGAQSLTEGATDQASSIQELQATITNVSEEVDKNAENAKSANAMAQKVGEEIALTNTSMQEVVKAMEVINDTSLQINSVINTINDIASQTNLLALNASIEAARAGEAGRGFAVVATQVGQLATQSAEAAKGTTELIANAIRAVEGGKALVDVAANKLVEAAGKTTELVSNIGEISIASENQAVALSQILQAADQIAAVVEENTAMAEESEASSEELAAQATKLKQLIENFKLYEEK